MKKSFLIVALVLFLGIINVFAATENQLLEKFAEGYVVGGVTVKATDYQLNEAKRYLNKYEVSEADCDFIIAKMDEIYGLALSDNAKSFTELSDASKAKAVAIVAEISNKTSVKATLTKNGILTIYESDGKTVFAQIVDKHMVKQTGSNNIIFVALSIVSVFGIAYIAKKAISTNA